MKRRIQIFAATGILFLSFVIMSCQKESSNNSGNPPGPAATLSINFPAHTIPITNIDSAKVTFSKGGTVVEKKMTENAGQLTVSMAGLGSGDWETICTIYSMKTPTDFAGRIYVDTFNISNPATTGKTLRAPLIYNGDDWERYIVMSSNNDEVMIKLALDMATNPFFEIKVKDPSQWSFLHIERFAYYQAGTTRTLLGDDDWNCFGQCFTGGILQNNTAFLGLASQLRGKVWNHGEFNINVLNLDPAKDVLFQYYYSR